MRAIFLLAAIGFSMPCWAEETVTCKPDGNNAEMTQCQQDAAAKADKELQAAFAALRERIIEHYGNESAALEALQKANQHWQEGMSAECLLENLGLHEGTISYPILAKCAAEAIEKRAAQYKAELESLEALQ